MSEQARWPYPVVERGSKLGVHAIFFNRVREFAAALVAEGAAFPVVKAVSDVGWLPEVKQVSPRTITLGRIASPDEGCGPVVDPSADLDAAADVLLGYVLRAIDGDPRLAEGVDYWEICNEPDPPGVDGYRRLAELMIRCMDRAERHGLKLGIFALCAGTPEWDEMVAMVETGVFGRAREGGHILTLHEGIFGNDPVDQWWGDLIPGGPPVEGAGPLCFRYRYLYHLLQQRGEVVPLVVSEFYAGGGREGEITPEEVVERMRLSLIHI